MPPLERTLNRDSVLAMLPPDVAGHADWVQALRNGLMRPRSAKGAPRYRREDGPRFGFDFYFSGPDTSLDAWFPHSVHADVMDCRQCHGPIVQYRGQPISMSDIFAGEFCGRCHGKVAFPVMTDCKRCHRRGPFPESGGTPELMGDIEMMRAHGDSGIAAGVVVDALPRATFPHWVHRIRFQCRACHTELFEPRAGANLVLMSDIKAGKACGHCHDGTTAFSPTLGNCQLCHVKPS